MKKGIVYCEPTQEIRDYLDLIDEKYFEAKREGRSRLSVAWGKWSAEMNRETRRKIKEKHPQAILLKYVFNYWVNRSQLLESYCGGRLKQLKLKRLLKKEGRVLKKMILSGGVPVMAGEDEARILARLL